MLPKSVKFILGRGQQLWYQEGVTKDGRKLDRSSQERLRISACTRVAGGESVTDVMSSCGYSRTTYYKWLKEYESKGIGALKRRHGSGSSPLVGKKHYVRITSWINGQDPRDFGYASGLWTRAIVSDLIEKKLKIKIRARAVGDLLARMNITPQKPLRRAYERDETAVMKWKNKT